MNLFDLSLLHLEATNRVRGIVADFQRQFYMVDDLEQTEVEVEEEEEVEDGLREGLQEE